MMLDVINRTFQRATRELQEALQECLNLAAREIAEPTEILKLLKGLNLGAFGVGSGGIGPKPGFDPYLVLGLKKEATDDEVKKAYHDLISRLHPDKVGRDTSFLAAVVNLAYEQIKRERKNKARGMTNERR